MGAASKPGKSQAAIGFRCHSGWTMLVAIAGTGAAPEVVMRRRVELSKRTPRQPFHAAEGRSFASAEALIHRATGEATTLADGGLRQALAELRAAGHQPVASGLLLSAGRALPGLREVLASHALIHAAEGDLFRDVLRQASRRCGLRALEVRERDLEDAAARALRQPASELTQRVAQWGKLLGPPWTQDQKRAALVAWLALAGEAE